MDLEESVTNSLYPFWYARILYENQDVCAVENRFGHKHSADPGTVIYKLKWWSKPIDLLQKVLKYYSAGMIQMVGSHCGHTRGKVDLGELNYQWISQFL